MSTDRGHSITFRVNQAFVELEQPEHVERLSPSGLRVDRFGITKMTPTKLQHRVDNWQTRTATVLGGKKFPVIHHAAWQNWTLELIEPERLYMLVDGTADLTFRECDFNTQAQNAEIIYCEGISDELLFQPVKYKRCIFSCKEGVTLKDVWMFTIRPIVAPGASSSFAGNR